MDKHKEKKIWFLIIILTLIAAGVIASFFGTNSKIFRGTAQPLNINVGQLPASNSTIRAIRVSTDASLTDADITRGVETVVAKFVLNNNTGRAVNINRFTLYTRLIADELYRTNITHIKLFNGNNQISGDNSPRNRDGRIEWPSTEFGGNLFTISATPITLTIKATIADDAPIGKKFSLQMKDANAIVVINTAIIGSFPINGPTFTVSAPSITVNTPLRLTTGPATQEAADVSGGGTTGSGTGANTIRGGTQISNINPEQSTTESGGLSGFNGILPGGTTGGISGGIPGGIPGGITGGTSLPDLVTTTTAAAPTSAAIGESITISGLVRNLNTRSSSSSQTVLRIDGTVVGSQIPTGTLPMLGTKQVSWNWTAAGLGAHTAQICADETSLVIESNETNNCTSPVVSFTVTGTAAETTTPQLSVSLASDSPLITVPLSADWFTATKLQFTATSRAEIQRIKIALRENLTNGLPYDEIDKIQLFESTNSGGENQISSQQSLTSLGKAEFELNPPWIIDAPALTRTLIIKAKLKTTAANAGKHFGLGVKQSSDITVPSNILITNSTFPIMGAERSVQESNTGGGGGGSSSGGGGGGGASGTPNLNINSTPSFSPNNPKKNDTINFSVNIKNIGTGAASSTTTRLYIDTNGSYLVDNPSTWEVQQSQATQALGSNNETTVTLPWPSATEGTRSYMICADATTVVSESNENNNCSVIQTFSVAATAQAGASTINTQAGENRRTSNRRQTSTNTATTNNLSNPQQTGNAALSNEQLRTAASQQEQPELQGSVRLRKAPERGNTGPGILVYFGVLAAIQGGAWIRKKLRK